jgi:hypothetical protein
LPKANRAIELFGNFLNYRRSFLLFAIKIQVFQEFLKIGDPLIYFIKIIVLFLWLRSYKFFVIFLLLCFYFVFLPHLLQDLLSLFGVSSDSGMLKGTLEAVTPKSMLALFTHLGLDLVNYLSLLEDCFAFFDFRSGLWNLRNDDHKWMLEGATLFVAIRTPLTVLSDGLRRRSRNHSRRRNNNNRSWWLVV